MKVTLVNHSDSLGGASVVTYRLMHALRRLGVDARMLVTSKTTDDRAVTQAASRLRSRLPFLAEHLEIFIGNGRSRADLFKASIATAGLPLSRHPLVRDADAVILNWVNQGMLSLGEIGRIASAKPTVWTMHDMWNMTGICHHAALCGRYLDRCCDCPLLHSSAGPHDLAARTFDRKMELYHRRRIRFVAVSSWLADRARGSALMRDADIEMIPNPFFVDEAAAPVAMTRADAGLPAEGRLVVMCAARLDDPVKGLPIAVEAFNRLGRTDIIPVFVGALRDPRALDGLQCRFIRTGPIDDPERLRAIYHHASAVLSTSSYESFGATLVEGQAAGCVPVAFAHDGRADIVIDGKTGYTADYPDAAGISRAIARAVDDPIPPEQLAGHAGLFSWQHVGRRYIDLIQSML
ncbi:MAG: glycosyltransferase [Bacteroidales bacterium]|nr:glycosyltransferase [Bacteroidales bacterium]